jgi:hypothetical protein
MEEGEEREEPEKRDDWDQHEEVSQDFHTDWALRILTCVRAACRRQRNCTRLHDCPMLKVFPIERWQEIVFRRKVSDYLRMRRFHAEGEVSDEQLAAARRKNTENAQRWIRIAFERAEEKIATARREGRSPLPDPEEAARAARPP